MFESCCRHRNDCKWLANHRGCSNTLIDSTWASQASEQKVRRRHSRPRFARKAIHVRCILWQISHTKILQGVRIRSMHHHIHRKAHESQEHQHHPRTAKSLIHGWMSLLEVDWIEAVRCNSRTDLSKSLDPQQKSEIWAADSLWRPKCSTGITTLA